MASRFPLDGTTRAVRAGNDDMMLRHSAVDLRFRGLDYEVPFLAGLRG